MFFNDDLFFLHSIFKDKIRIVGGATRNFILKQKITDYDLSCLLNPDDVKKELEKHSIRYLTIGEKHGTITAILNGKNYEITSTRMDVKTDGRWADVKYIDDFEADSQRRDFTFNAIYLDFQGNTFDYHNGISDLQKGIVRFIGNAECRIKEDYLRILRFFRFFACYGFILDNDSINAVVKLKDNLKIISKERIREEIFKIFNAKYPIKALKLMNQLNIFNGNYKNLEIFYSYKAFLKYDLPTTMAIALFIETTQELKLTNKEKKEIQNYLKIKNYEYFSIQERKEMLFENKDKNLLIFNCFVNDKNILEVVDFIDKTTIPRLPVNGNDFTEYNGSDIYKMIKLAKELFILSDFKISRDELLKKLLK